ncbi:hypothetical protein WICPIJ_008612 [Wickerhamomyces pijperi]|uniref:Uncharacterized protein n=1 Tax=Wickerhamomyces pijperi TaxID=599730 RepID=A0A9P8PWA0_WICPI|nr:hypothetical protein WICPIJ_008612 [Wickerhamomyces pijperi]
MIKCKYSAELCSNLDRSMTFLASNALIKPKASKATIPEPFGGISHSFLPRNSRQSFIWQEPFDLLVQEFVSMELIGSSDQTLRVSVQFSGDLRDWISILSEFNRRLSVLAVSVTPKAAATAIAASTALPPLLRMVKPAEVASGCVEEIKPFVEYTVERRDGYLKNGSEVILYLAPTTKTFFLAFIPSISVNNWLTTRSPAPESPGLPPLALAIESNSSKKTTVGAAARALSKISRMLDSDSPKYILNNSGPLTEMKLAETSVATALANKVLPVPGGPKNNTPLDGDKPNLEYCSGCKTGYSTVSFNSLLIWSKPPISSQVTLTDSTTVSRKADGLELPKANLKFSMVTPKESKTSASISSSSRSINGVWNTDINFTIESTKSSQGRINGVRSVDNSSFNFTVGLVSLWSNRIDFINEDNGWGVLFSFFESLSQVGFGLTSHLGHDFWTVDQEEESTGFIGNGSGHKGLTSTWRTVHKNTLWRLDTNGLEQLWVSQWQFNQFSNLGHLLSATTKIVVTDFVDVVFFVFSVDWLTFRVDDSVLRDNGVFGWLNVNNLEFNLSHTTTDNEVVTFLDWSVGFNEVWLQVDIEQGPSQTLNCVSNWQNGNLGGVLDIWTWMNGNNVT